MAFSKGGGGGLFSESILVSLLTNVTELPVVFFTRLQFKLVLSLSILFTANF